MENGKSHYSNTYAFRLELLLTVLLCFLSVCCVQKQTKQVFPANGGNLAENALNINTANAGDLEKLPSIGPKRASQIIEFREKYGKFLKPEQLILVEGMSDAKYRRIRNLVKVE